MTDGRSLLAELKRRNVLRAAALYIGTAWALSQGIAQLGPAFGMPDWGTRWFVAACATGFPIWIAFAWFYAWTPEGFRREEEVEHDSSRSHSTGRKLDFLIIGVLAVAVVLLATNQFVLRRDATSVADIAAVAKLPEKSVAVLPFANESGDPKQQYFSDGLSEQLISDLTQINGLKVIGKYSSFQFRDSKDSPARIGAALGVAHLIEGSVRQSGDRLRIVVNLIRAGDGVSIWSHAYDQKFEDVFAIQSEIGDAAATALRVKLLGKTMANYERPPGGNVDAYRLVLQGRDVAKQWTEPGFRRAIDLYRQALELDPDYAFAWVLLSNLSTNLGTTFLQGEARNQAFAEARKAADKAASLAPDSFMAHIARGYVFDQVDQDHAGALAEFHKAYALAPNDVASMNFLANGLSNAGQPRRAEELIRKVVDIDPMRADTYSNLAATLTALGRFDDAEKSADKAIGLQPDMAMAYSQLAGIALARGQQDIAERDARKALSLAPQSQGSHALLAQIAILRGDTQTALAEAARETDPDIRAAALALAKQMDANAGVADAALDAYIDKYGKTHAYNVAILYAQRRQPDRMFDWLQRARTTDVASIATGLLADPFLSRYRNDPRFAALCRTMGLPVPGKVATTKL